MGLNSVLKQVRFDKNATFYLSLFCFIITIFVFKLTAKRRNKSKLPPSPFKLPLIGNLHQLGTLPHRSFRHLSHKYGPLMLLHLGHTPTLVVSSADIAREIFISHDVVFSNRPLTTAAKIFLYGCKDVGYAPYGEEWRQKRRICVHELLSLKRVRSFRFIREEEVAELVSKIGEACENNIIINLTHMLIATSNNIVSRCILGQKYDYSPDGAKSFGDVARTVMIQFVGFSVGNFFPSLGWIDHVTGLIPKLKSTFGELDGFFDEDMFVAGSDASSTTLEWAMSELLRNPTIMTKAQDEIRRVVDHKSKVDEKDVGQMKYLECVVKETLRLHPPAPLLVPRETRSGVKIRGYHIPQKTSVYINAWAIQRDPEIWERPEEFVPERFENNEVDFRGQYFQFIPFGTGRRGCPGVSFGIALVEYMLANLLYWFDWKLPGVSTTSAQDIDMSERYGVTVTRKVPLHLQPLPHSL
ncbi:cytochrome P450 71A1-like [Senna tora]|uniref:Cytochrome P450 71A1-like n=1 Tax=Senna tora TaxID=362788 RepID=A0A834X5L0_9FABA|nr:cytochrome P450 71A1-like [Senna tora]